MTSLTLTVDELDALAQRLGARRFPGVSESIFDSIPAEQHARLTACFLATLAARGVVAEQDGRLVASEAAAVLLGPTLHGQIRYEIEQSDSETTLITALGEAGRAVVWQRADGPYHRFDLLATDGDVAQALATLLDPPATADPGACGPATGDRPFRARRSRLACGDLAATWRSLTTVTQVAAPNADPAATWLGVVDGQPGQRWLLQPAADDPLDEDPLVQVQPLAPGELRRRLRAWCGSVL